MINGITNEFGQVLFDGARVPAENMIGEPGEGWRVAMTIVSHEREPGELGYVARYAKTVKELEHTVRADPAAFRGRPARGRRVGARAGGDAAAPRVPPALRAARRHRARPRRLDRQAADDVGRAEPSAPPRSRCRARTRSSTPTTSRSKVYLYSRAQSVMGGTSQIQKNIIATRILGLPDGLNDARTPDEVRPARRDPRRGRRAGAHRAAEPRPSSSTRSTTSCTSG